MNWIFVGSSRYKHDPLIHTLHWSPLLHPPPLPIHHINVTSSWRHRCGSGCLAGLSDRRGTKEDFPSKNFKVSRSVKAAGDFQTLGYNCRFSPRLKKINDRPIKKQQEKVQLYTYQCHCDLYPESHLLHTWHLMTSEDKISAFIPGSWRTLLWTGFGAVFGIHAHF